MVLDKKRLILVGKAASGKDYLRKLLQSEGLKYQISYTTRPPRNGEVDGVDYFFLTREAFQDMISLDKFYEYVEFNTWFYGTSKEQFDTEDSIFIMTPAGLSHLNTNDRDESLVIYLDVNDDIRRERMMQRNDADNAERRIKADAVDFENFENYDILIDNPSFDIEEIYNSINRYSELSQDIMKHIVKSNI